MKSIRSIITYFIILLGLYYTTPSTLYSQNYEIKDPNLKVRNFKFEQNVYIPEMGTKGFMFIFEYSYTSASKYLVTFPQEITGYKYGHPVFSDSSSYLIMRPNQWRKARKFIPYRTIDLPNGIHDNLEIVYQVKDLITFRGTMNYNQPTRYAINLSMKEGKAKPIAGSYDNRVAPQESNPDIYWTVTTNEGEFPVFISNVNQNSFSLKEEDALFYVLEGDSIRLNFYDQDDGADLKLASRVLVESSFTDFKKEELGQMFGYMKGVNYVLSQRKMIRQPISTYVRKDIEYNGRKGVQLVFDYYLTEALKGANMKPIITYKSKDGKIIKMPFCYALDDAPPLGTTTSLEKEGRLKYFIPYYAWDNSTHIIEFLFEGDNATTAEAAPYFIHNPITFDKYISYSGYVVEEDYNYLGAHGIKLSVSYKVKDINQYSKLEISFLDTSDAPIQAAVYPLNRREEGINPLASHIDRVDDMIAEDTLEYFIPYAHLNVSQVKVNVNLIPDLVIPLIRGISPVLKEPTSYSDVNVEKIATSSRFIEGDFGFVMELKCHVPEFYKNRAFFDVSAKRNGVEFPGYNVIGSIVKKVAVDTFEVISKDSSTIYIVFPYRRMESKDKITVECKLVESARGIVLSDTISATKDLSSNIHNVDAEFILSKLEFLPDPKGDENDDNVDWKYVLTVGNEVKISKTLKKKIKGKEMSTQYSRMLRVHREDLIQIKVVNKNKLEDEVFLWSGDLGKFLQNRFRSVVKDQKPIKKAKVRVKASKQQLRGKRLKRN